MLILEESQALIWKTPPNKLEATPKKKDGREL
jgi:hypothetical protein